MDVGTVYKLDISEALAGFDKISQADAQFRATVQQTGAQAKKSFSDAAQAAIDLQNKQAAATAEVANAAVVHRELRGVLNDLRAAEKDLEKERRTSKAGEQAAKLTGELRRNREEQARVRAEIKLTEQAINEEREAASRIKEELRAQQQAQKLTTAAGRDAAAVAKQRAKEEKEAAAAAEKSVRSAGILTQLEQKLTDLTERRAKASTRTEVRGYNKQIQDTQKEIADLKGEADKTGGAVGGMFGRFAGAAGAAAAVGIVVGFVKNLADQVIEAGKKADATLGKLQFARGGDLEKAAADGRQLAFEAERLGLNLNSAGASYGSFTAAAAAGNLPLAEARRLYLAVGGAAAVLKVSSENTEGALLALQQMVSKGTVSAEELRGQLGERLPGAFAIAARAIGVTEKELGKMLQRGEIAASDFLPKFARELEKTFGDGTAQAANSLQANTNRIDNEWQRFLLRFTSATGRAVSSIAKFSKQANDFLDGLTPEGQADLAATRAAAGVKRYQTRLEKALDQTATSAKQRGGNVAEAVERGLDVNQARLQKSLAEAEAVMKKYSSPGYINEFNAAGGGGYNELRPLIEANQRRVALLRGELQALQDVRVARKKATEDEDKNLQGLIEKQQLLIKNLQDRQKAARNENAGDGADFLFGKGGLNQQLAAAQKELDRLLGKVEKGAKQRANALAAALRALYAEEERLRKDAARMELAQLKDEGQARAAEQLRQSLAEINRTEQLLKDKEAAVRKAGGRGGNADGVIDGVQAKQLTALRLAALDAYYTDLLRISEAREQRLFDLRADSDAKEVEAVNRKYDKLVAAARGNATELFAIEQARERDLLALRFQQQQKAIDETAQIGRDTVAATIGEVYGTGTGISEIEAKRAEKKALLEIDRKHAQDTLNNTLLLTGKQGEISRQAAEAELARIKNALNALEQEKRRHAPEDFLYKLILGEDDNEENRRDLDETVAIAEQTYRKVLEAQLQSAQASIDAKTRQVDEVQRELDRELEYQKAGSASSVNAKREEIAQLKAERRRAIEDQKQAQRIQLVLDSAEQSSSLFTASANIYKGTSKLDAVLPGLGVAAGTAITALLVGAFVGSKLKALQAINNQGSGYFKGGYTGGDSIREERGPVHGKEFVFDNEKTSKYRFSLFEPLHTGKPIDWGHPTLAPLLPDLDAPKQLREARQAALQVQHHHTFAPLQAGIDRMEARMKAVESHVSRLPYTQTTIMPDGTVVETNLENGGTAKTRIV
ncbi:tape measure protein [Hymenobacter busanensis]|uniref:Tape measure protein n=1 Tax=Hymenobacter busanensis TaxID=2607656 RepID=A0A7L4ZXB9_9BACT|nr:tape measure protein [Hymenobacter busanensis]KAA9333409.1 tape measure protein [Hymenobacter busanensis]QHJ07911.1 tape measure protein [Hymenobacter busanensis]